MVKTKNGAVDHKTAITICGIIVVAVALAALLLFLMHGKETRNSTGESSEKIGVLLCKSNIPKTPFFKVTSETSSTHEIKVTFKNDTYDVFSYTYDAKFSSEAKVKEAEALLHADYNTYMSGIGLDPEGLSPAFSNATSELLINLYIPRNKLTVGTGKFAFLDEGEFTAIDHYSVNDFKKMYSGKGFTCQYTE